VEQRKFNIFGRFARFDFVRFKQIAMGIFCSDHRIKRLFALI